MSEHVDAGGGRIPDDWLPTLETDTGEPLPEPSSEPEPEGIVGRVESFLTGGGDA